MTTHLTKKPAEIAQATVMLGLASASPAMPAWSLLLHAAQGLAQEQEITVALAGIQRHGNQNTFTVDILGADPDDDIPQLRLHAASPSVDMQIARALHRLRPLVGLWIIAAPDPDAATFSPMAGVVREWLLSTATDNDGLVAGYQYLKRAWANGAAHHPVEAAGALPVPGPAAGVPAVFLLSDDYAHAALVHKRLRKAAQEFLKTDLRFAGAGPMSIAGNSNNQHAHEDAPAQHPRNAITFPISGPDDTLWAAVLDELCPLADAEAEPTTANHLEQALDDVATQAAQVSRSAHASFAVFDHLANVLDPEERAALAMDFEEPGLPPAPVATRGHSHHRNTVDLPFDSTFRHDDEIAEPAAPKPVVAIPQQPQVEKTTTRPAVVPAAPSPAQAAAPDQPRHARPTLRAFDLEEQCDRPAQWQAVERSIWDLLPKSVLIEAKPPMSWATDTCIAIDREGRLHIWTLYKDGASWFALREWASEHRNLLALTRRDLTVSKDADVSVHIVLPLTDDASHGDAAAAAAQAAGHAPHQSHSPSASATSENMVAILMRTPSPNIHLYRLRIVQWNARRGMIVVPLV